MKVRNVPLNVKLGQATAEEVSVMDGTSVDATRTWALLMAGVAREMRNPMVGAVELASNMGRPGC